MSVVDEVRDRTDIVELISEYVPLSRAGRAYKARCPFHQERTPSFFVDPDRRTWRCFGACATGGDVFSFLMRAENVDFREALRRLAERAGLPLQPAATEARRQEAHARLYAALEAAALFYANLLLTSGEGELARAHLRARGLEKEAWETFQLGQSPSGWETLCRYLRDRGFTDEELVDSGLAARRESGGLYDRFRHRLMIPIRDLKGRTIGFGARLLSGDGPKYINSPATPLFDKSAALFGLDRAQKAIRAADRVVVVEGYFDVVTAHLHGALEVVGSMGTAITPKQIASVKRLTKNLILALDPDAAGDEATLRGIEVAREAFDRTVLPVPTWQGLVRYDSQLDASIRILELPRGVDPDELIRTDHKDWQHRVAAARPVIDYLFEAVTSRLDLTRSKDKSRAVEQLLPVVREIADPVQQAHYLQRLARLVQVDERTLAAAVARVRNRPAAGTLANPEPALPRPVSAEARLEAYLVELVRRFPSLRARIDELEPQRFDSAPAREILRKLQELDTTRLDIDIADNLNFGVGARLPELDLPSAEKAFGEALRRLRAQRLRQSLQSIGSMQNEAEEAGEDLVVQDLAQKTVQFSHALGQLHREQRRTGGISSRPPQRTRRI